MLAKVRLTTLGQPGFQDLGWEIVLVTEIVESNQPALPEHEYLE